MLITSSSQQSTIWSDFHIINLLKLKIHVKGVNVISTNNELLTSITSSFYICNECTTDNHVFSCSRLITTVMCSKKDPKDYKTLIYKI